MDIAMPGLNGIEATRKIIAAVPQCKVITLSMHADKRYITEMLKAGASGYLLKDRELPSDLGGRRPGRGREVYRQPGEHRSRFPRRDHAEKKRQSGAR